MGKDFENPFGKTTPKGVIRKMSSLFDSGVFPGIQGGPLVHVIAAKAVSFKEAMTDEYQKYQAQVVKNVLVPNNPAIALWPQSIVRLKSI